MKKTLALALILGALILSGCGATTSGSAPEPTAEPKAENKFYTASGRYYVNGIVITEDGNEWGYSQDVISEKESYDDEPVFVVFDDKGTPGDIYDDAILELILDRETAIYDALEVALSEEFTVERNGNRLEISK